jgi:hypothetical protein
MRAHRGVVLRIILVTTAHDSCEVTLTFNGGACTMHLTPPTLGNINAAAQVERLTQVTVDVIGGQGAMR